MTSKDRQSKVRNLVKEVYLSSDIEFARWIYSNHVEIVSDFALELTNKVGNCSGDLAYAGALLHDFADAFIEDRHDKLFEMITEREATKILKMAKFDDNEISHILKDVIKPHSCRDGLMPKCVEAKVVATADALAHLTTTFYFDLETKGKPTTDKQMFKKWASEKIERDYKVKIFFDDVRESVKEKYLKLKESFS